MPGIAYVNGRYLPIDAAEVHVEDRGYQFADGIYEVCLLIDGRLWDLDGHLERMERSLGELRIETPMSRASIVAVMKELARRNRLTNGLIYIQATRGRAKRNHAFPATPARPALVMTARPFDLNGGDEQAKRGIKVITRPDIRWGRVDIKTVGLLPNVLAKQAAKEAGAGEALFVRNGFVTEGGSSNAWIATADGALVTHPATNDILGGVTRQTAIACAEELQIRVEERAFSVEEAKAAPEAFLTSATGLVMPVVEIDGAPVGEGRPGPIAKRLREAYKDRARRLAPTPRRTT